MATSPPKSNEQYTSTYYNQNQCYSFNRYITTSVTQLSGQDPNESGTTTAPAVATKAGQPCSEVIIYNTTSGNLFIYTDTSGAFSHQRADHRIMLATTESTAVRGITNVNQVSAIAASAGVVYYRTQFFSSNPVR